jgi:hypothetical protein
MRITPAHDPGNRIRLVCEAAAIDHDWLRCGERYGLALCRAERLLNLRNSEDCALCFYKYRKPCGRGSLGRTGITADDFAGMGPLADKAREIEITEMIHHHHLCEHYFHATTLARAIWPFVYYAD